MHTRATRILLLLAGLCFGLAALQSTWAYLTLRLASTSEAHGRLTWTEKYALGKDLQGTSPEKYRRDDKARRMPIQPYPYNVTAAQVAHAWEREDCYPEMASVPYRLVRAERGQGVTTELTSELSNTPVFMQRVFARAYPSPYVLVLHSDSPAIWQVNAHAQTQLLQIVLAGHPRQFVLGTSPNQEVRYLPDSPPKGFAYCNLTARASLEGALMAGLRFAEGQTDAPVVDYPYQGPPSTLSGDNNLDMLRVALSMHDPWDHREMFKEKFDNVRHLAGWRYATNNEVSEWSRRDGPQDTEHRPTYSFHTTGTIVLTTDSKAPRFLDLPEEVAQRVVYLGPRSAMKGHPGSALVLDTEQHACIHLAPTSRCPR